ncbi:MAG TPA: hypothetical protein VJ880_00560, partial [Allomuricauda sp.]|nr:hypothetical protein [Allomuricauda sp.]
WVGTDDGRVHYTLNGGETWVDVTKNIKGLPTGSWIPQIKASNRNKGEALLVANDYRRFNYTPYAYRTKDYGKTWTRIVDENDVESYTLSIIEDPENPNLMFLGTDDGLYVSLDAGSNWKKWNKGFPTVSTKDLAIHPREHDLVIGTFGRAAWVLDDIRPLRKLAGNTSILQKEISLFNSPNAYLAAYQQPSGGRFGGDAVYNGDNRESGAMITYYLKEGNKMPKEEKKDENNEEKEADEEKSVEKTKDSIFFEFYDGDRLIRTLKYKTPEKAGFHRIYWNLDEKGPDRPSRTISKRTRERGGVDVKPGTYKVKIVYGEATDSTSITVKTDPRLDVNLASINEVYETSKKLEGYTQTAADAVKQLVESKDLANKFKKELKELDKDKFKEQIKASEEIVKQIDSVVALYLGKDDKRQGIVRNPEPTVMSRLQTANRYVSSRKTGITATERRMIQFAEEELKGALDQTNAFFNEKWKSYRTSIESLDLSPFKKTESFNLNNKK